jgi:integration host factor subunit alpha
MAELVLKEIADCIARGETVKLSSFGTFTVRKKRERLGRNPKTGVEVPIAPHRVVVFKASAIMKKQVNAKRPVSVEIADPPRQGQAAIDLTLKIPVVWNS